MEKDSSLKPNFFDEISRHRAGGIDVSKHSKERRKLRISDYDPTQSPPLETTTERSKFENDDNGGQKPMLKVGIVLPHQIFQQRRYQTIIRNSLGEIAQEKCLGDEEIGHENDTFFKYVPNNLFVLLKDRILAFYIEFLVEFYLYF